MSVSHEPSAQPIVSIVVPLFNAVHYTRAMLPSLRNAKNSTPYEVIIVDNNSTDDTRAFLATLPASFKVILNDTNRNFAGACNQGAQAASGEFLVFLNNDTLLTDGWLDALLEPARRDAQVAVVGNKQIFPHSGLLHHGGMYFDDARHPKHYLLNIDPDDPRVNYEREFSCVTGACMLVRRSVFAALNGFDEAYKNGYEDVDLCLRVTSIGGKIVYTPRSWIFHHTSKSPGRSDHNLENWKLFMQRWMTLITPNRAALEAPDVPIIERALAAARSPIAIVAPQGPAGLFAEYLKPLVREMRKQFSYNSEIFLLTPPSANAGNDKDYWVRAAAGADGIIGELQALKVHHTHFITDDQEFSGAMAAEVMRRANAAGITFSIGIIGNGGVSAVSSELANSPTNFHVSDPQLALLLAARGIDANRTSAALLSGAFDTTPAAKEEAYSRLKLPPQVKLLTVWGTIDAPMLDTLLSSFSRECLQEPWILAFPPLTGVEQAAWDTQVKAKNLDGRAVQLPRIASEEELKLLLSASDAVVFTKCGAESRDLELLVVSEYARALKTPTAAYRCTAFQSLAGCARMWGNTEELCQSLRELNSPEIASRLRAHCKGAVSSDQIRRSAEALVALVVSSSNISKGATVVMGPPIEGAKVTVSETRIFEVREGAVQSEQQDSPLETPATHGDLNDKQKYH